MKRCVILCAAPINSYSWLKQMIRPDDFLICADGGFHHTEAIERTPDILLGDFDSGKKPINASFELTAFPPEKDYTDSMLALKTGIERGFKDFLLLGGLGGRIDHSFANLSLLTYALDENVTLKLADEQNTLEVIRDESKSFKRGETGEMLSVFPLGGYAYGVTLKGVKYPLNEYTMEAVCSLGVSNEITDEFANITVAKGTLLIVRSHDTI